MDCRRLFACIAVCSFLSLNAQAIENMTFRWTDTRTSGPQKWYRVYYWTSSNVATGQPSGNWNTIPLNPGASYDILLSGNDGATFYHGAADATSGTPPLDWQSSPVTAAASPYNLDIGTFAPATCVKVLPVTNTDIVTVRVHWVLNGVSEYVEDLEPGETVTHTLSPPDCDNYSIDIQEYRLVLTSDYELVEEGIDLETITNDPDDNETITVDNTPQTGPQIDSQTSTGATDPIDWTATNEQEAIQQGFSSLIIDQRSDRDLEIGLLNKIATNVAVLQYEEIDQDALRNGFSSDSITSSNSLTTLGNQFGGISTTIGGTDPNPVLQIPITGTDIVLDLDPMSNSSTVQIFSWIRTLFQWLITIWLCVACFRILREQINTFLNSPQVKLGSKTPIVGAAISVFAVTAIAGIIAGGVVLVSSLSIFGTYLAELLLQPFQNPTGIVSYAVWLLNKIFPLAYAIAALNAWFIYEMAASAITVGVSLAIRAVAFCLPFVLLVAQANAGTMHLDNWTGNDISVGGYVVPPGQHKLILPDGSYSIIDGTNNTAITVDGNDIFRSRQVYYSGSTLTASTTTLDQEFDLFWIGFVLGLTVWAFWFGMNWVKRIALDNTNYD